MLHIFSAKSLQPKYLVFAVLTAYFFFGFQHLSHFVTADEHYWVYERIPQYWDAVAEGKWKKTFINDKPGVSLALVSGIGYFLHPDSPEHCTQSGDKLLHCKTDRTENLYFAFRLPILIVNGLLLLYLFWIIGKLTNPWIALWTTTLTALSPILLGISQIVNPDALLWSLASLSIFSFLVLLKYPQKKYIALTALFTGLALLSKYAAIILLPFYLIFTIGWFLLAPDKEIPAPRKTLLRNLFSILWIILGASLILCFFLPAIIINPKALNLFLLAVPNKSILLFVSSIPLALFLIDTFFFKNILLLKLRSFCQKYAAYFSILPISFLLLFITVISSRLLFPEWDIFTRLPFDIKDITNFQYYIQSLNIFQIVLLEWSPFIFSLAPAMLLGLIFVFMKPLRHQTHPYIFLSFVLCIVAVFYMFIIIYSNVLATVRYSILLYPIFALLSALGFWLLAERFSKHSWSKALLTAIIFGASFLSLISIQPFYFNYNNIFLPKKSVLNDAWGYGGYEAAMYLNALPKAKELTVWADYYGVCEFFIGHCLTAYGFDKERDRPDYYVLTRRGGIRYLPRYLNLEAQSGLVAYKYYTTPDPAWQLFIDNRPGNFVKAVKVTK